MPDVKSLVKFLGSDFSTCHESTRKISRRASGQNSEKILRTPFQISRLFPETSFSRSAGLKLATKTQHTAGTSCDVVILASSTQSIAICADACVAFATFVAL